MKALVTVLLTVMLSVGGWTAVLAQSSHPAKSATLNGPQGQMTTPDTHEEARDTPAASPRTGEPQKALGLRASTAIFLGAVLFFIIVLVAAEVSREKPSYRRPGIDPRR
jgi:hypothetical protein